VVWIKGLPLGLCMKVVVIALMIGVATGVIHNATFATAIVGKVSNADEEMWVTQRKKAAAATAAAVNAITVVVC
jgi:hypothetical protein